MGEDVRGLRCRDEDLMRLNGLLEQADETRSAVILTVRGRRMVGKSTLVERARIDSSAEGLFFTARRDEPSERALGRFLTELRREAQREVTLAEADLARSATASMPPESWRDALLLAGAVAIAATEGRRGIGGPRGSDGRGSDPGGGRIGAPGGGAGCVVIDEAPWLLEQELGLERELRAAWDAGLRDMPLLLAIVGADEQAIASLSEDGRPLAELAEQIEVRPASPAEVAEITGLSTTDALDVWCAIGGLPPLLSRWQARDGLTSYLRRELADPTSPLVVCGERIVTAELPPRSAARAVLSAIGEGETEFGRMVSRTNIGRTAVSGALKTHARRGNVVRRTPLAVMPDKRLTTYAIADPYLNFWLRFLWQGLPEIRRGRSDLVLRRVSERWPGFVERAIEPLVLEALSLLAPGGASAVGTHWTRNPKDEAPLVGADSASEPSEAAFVGKLLWREDEKLGAAEAAELAHLRDTVPYASLQTPLLGVSRAGFAPGAPIDIAIGPEELLAAWRERVS